MAQSPTESQTMLLRFSVQNMLSIYERQEFSLIATSLKGPVDSLFKTPAAPKFDILPIAVVYGANASGKTNLTKAFQFLCNMVLFSHSRGDPSGGIGRQPFALDPKAVEMPTAVDLDFIVENVRYHYGFEANNERFISEWLYSFPEGSRRKLFERKNDSVDFGPTMKGSKKLLIEFMRPNSLFLSTATQNDHEELSKIVSFFRNSIYNSSVSVAGHSVNYQFKSKNIDQRTISLLKDIGTGVVDFRKIESFSSEEERDFARKLMNITKNALTDQTQSTQFEESFSAHIEKNVKFELGHQGVDGEINYFPLERESSGTRRLLVILDLVFKALDSGSLIILDELDASLHTHASDLILSLFSNKSINKNGAQLIATTHDTNLMMSKTLRRDQIWFAEKDTHGATHIFPLSEIKTRQSDDFESGYLQGRYGAIPFAGASVKLFSGPVE